VIHGAECRLSLSRRDKIDRPCILGVVAFAPWLAMRGPMPPSSSEKGRGYDGGAGIRTNRDGK
jgi:hypothetical protein